VSTDNVPRLNHLQDIINRLADNSFKLKNWSLTLSTAVPQYALKDGFATGPIAFLAIPTVAAFWRQWHRAFHGFDCLKRAGGTRRDLQIRHLRHRRCYTLYRNYTKKNEHPASAGRRCKGSGMDQAGVTPEDDFIARQLRELNRARLRARLSLIVSSATLVLLLAVVCAATLLWLTDYHVVRLVQLTGVSPPPVHATLPIVHQWYSSPFKSGDAGSCVQGREPVRCDVWTSLNQHQVQRNVGDVLQPLKLLSLVIIVGGFDVSAFHAASPGGIRTNLELAQARAASVRSQIETALREQRKPIPSFITLSRAAEETSSAAERDRAVDITLVEQGEVQ
jgi:hypothetical protein